MYLAIIICGIAAGAATPLLWFDARVTPVWIAIVAGLVSAAICGALCWWVVERVETLRAKWRDQV